MIRKKENRPEAADYGRSNLRNQRRIDFLRKSLKFVCVFGHDDITALMKVLHDMLLPRYGAARYRGRRGSS